jgi:hypothetical protein
MCEKEGLVLWITMIVLGQSEALVFDFGSNGFLKRRLTELPQVFLVAVLVCGVVDLHSRRTRVFAAVVRKKMDGRPR